MSYANSYANSYTNRLVKKMKKIYGVVTQGGGPEADFYKHWSKYSMKKAMEEIKEICEID